MYKRQDEEKFEIAKQKGYFCYAFAESIAKCKGQKSIPEREVFKDLLGGESGITEKQHEFAKKSFDVFGCETLYCYMQLYCLLMSSALVKCFQSTVYQCILFSICGLVIFLHFQVTALRQIYIYQRQNFPISQTDQSIVPLRIWFEGVLHLLLKRLELLEKKNLKAMKRSKVFILMLIVCIVFR